MSKNLKRKTMLDLPEKVKHYMKSVEKTEKVDYVKLKEQYKFVNIKINYYIIYYYIS